LLIPFARRYFASVKLLAEALAIVGAAFERGVIPRYLPG
jgi:hypothetical protein